MFKKGDLLISEPFLPDQNFSRTVVLLAEHNEEGSVGFILNRLSNANLSDLSDEFENIMHPVYVGGPVEQNTLHFIHKMGDVLEDSIQIKDNYYWGGDFESLQNYVNIHLIDEKDIRFFVGYSGWEKGQLEMEYKNDSWIVISDYEQDIFSIDAAQLWREILKSKGGKYKELSNYPIDPRLN